MPDNAKPILLLTRPQAQAERFAAACQDEFGDSVEILIAPMQEIVLLPLPRMAPAAVLVFTSENGVRAYVAGGARTGVRAYCVGDRTAKAAREAGLDARSAGGAAGDLLALIRADAPVAPLVHLHGRHVRGQVVDGLRAAGHDATGHVVYEQRPLPLSGSALAALTGAARVLVPLFSPRSAALFAEALPSSADPVLVCISAATCAALPPGMQTRALVAEQPTSAAMLNAMARQLSP